MASRSQKESWVGETWIPEHRNEMYTRVKSPFYDADDDDDDGDDDQGLSKQKEEERHTGMHITQARENRW